MEAEESKKLYISTNMEKLDYQKSDNAVNDIRFIVEITQKAAYSAVDVVLLRRNWLIGKRITEEELNNTDRANYGSDVIGKLSAVLTNQYEKGFNKTNLYQFVQFYEMYPNFFHSVSGKSRPLSWTHYRVLLQVKDDNAREWYEKEAISQGWSVRTLQRNVSSQYYFRKLNSVIPDRMWGRWTCM